MLAQIETTLKAIDHASQQGLQWIVIALIVSLAAFAWYVIRYLVKREDAYAVKEDARAIREEGLSASRITAQLENTMMMKEVREVMHQVKSLLEKKP